MVVQQLTLASGCKNCKEKRLKCDERKPKCEQCEKKGVVCKGYEKTLKWRPQEDVFRSGTAPSRPRKGKDRAGWPLGGAFTDTPRIYYIDTSSQAPSELPTLRYLASINQQYLPCLPSSTSFCPATSISTRPSPDTSNIPFRRARPSSRTIPIPCRPVPHSAPPPCARKQLP